MNFDEFTAQNIGKKIEFDGAYPNQCVDLVNQYLSNVYQYPRIPGNAKDFIKNAPSNYFTYAKNTPLYIPLKGSIAVWDGSAGDGDGHVSVVRSSTLFKFVSLDQNWPKRAPVSEVEHNYKGVDGFLIPRARDIVGLFNQMVEEMRALTAKYPKVSYTA